MKWTPAADCEIGKRYRHIQCQDRMGKYDMGGQFEKGTDLGWYNLTDPKHRTLMRVKVVGASDEEAQ